jgi:hypothetical protein
MREKATTSIFPLYQHILFSFLSLAAQLALRPTIFPLPLLGQATHPVSFSRHLVAVLQNLLVLLMLTESDPSQTQVRALAASLP